MPNANAASLTQLDPPIPPIVRIPEATRALSHQHTVKMGHPAAHGIEDGESQVSSGNM